MKEPNCFGLVYHQLGLQEQDEHLTLDLVTLKENFDEASQLEAEVVAVIASIYDSNLLVHLALLHPQNKGSLIHRAFTGGPITTPSLEELRDSYWQKRYSFQFFARKTK
jgi:hypothetical protein